MDQGLSPATTAESSMAENLNGQYERFEIPLIYNLNEERKGDSKRSNTDCVFLNSNEVQTILSEVQVKRHFWSVNGVVQERLVAPTEGIYVRTVGESVRLSCHLVLVLYVCVKPALDAEESATLEVSSQYSQSSCFQIGPSSAISGSKYGPYKIKITIPGISRILDLVKLTLILGTKKVGHRNSIGLAGFLEYSKSLFQNHELSDVTLKIRGKEFPAHKLLLSSLSPVFKTMFLSDFRESRSNVVEIVDFEFEVIREMLKFIYTRERPQFRSSKSNIDTSSLYKASHKYEIKYLLQLCREELLSTINIKCALDVLLLADIYEDAFLKEKALDFICRNPPAVEDVSKCEEVVRQRPGLLKDILTCKLKQK